MNPLSFVFIGNSGSGKGTQSQLLKKFLEEKSPEYPVFYLETGSRFREFLKGDDYTNMLARGVYEAGGRQPDFLAIWNWSHILVESFKGNEHLIVDGAPRALSEAMAFLTAMSFYKRRAIVVYINVSRKWSEEHLLARGRADDKDPERLNNRLDWFEKDVVPAIDYFRVHSECDFVEINGEQSVEDVHSDIAKAISVMSDDMIV